MSWQFRDNEPVFVQIEKRLRADIVNGKYPPDSQIPPVRQLAFEAAVNPNTVQRALCTLENEGLLEAKGTVGRFVTCDPDVIDRARIKMRRDAVIGWLREAEELGITKMEFIDYLTKEEIGNE